jgi:hypothetical protein
MNIAPNIIFVLLSEKIITVGVKTINEMLMLVGEIYKNSQNFNDNKEYIKY